jgi:DNA-binding transcriptional LysR family regulator
MVEVPSAVAAVAFVRAGAGFSLMTSVHQTLAPDLAFVPLEHPTPAIQLAIASRRHEVNPIVDTFLRHVRNREGRAPR